MRRWGILVLLLLVFGLWLGSYCFMVARFGAPENSGIAGDTFGAINALFSGLALGGVILAIILQRDELRLQREELVLTREEMRTQNETLRLQRFENTFFGMLELHNAVLGQIVLYFSSGPEQGRAAFRHYFTGLSDLYVTIKDSADKQAPVSETSLVESAYARFFEKHQPVVGHYFRNLYQIIKFIDRSEVPDKPLYVGLVRAQLSSWELLLLFYNCVGLPGNRFKPLIEKYSLLEGIPQRQLLDPTHAGMYSHTAFGVASVE